MEHRNDSIDTVKGIACIFVILIHSPFPGNLGVVVTRFAGFAVPFFFMVSGYFTLSRDIEYIKKRIFKLGKLFIVTELIYICFDCLINLDEFPMGLLNEITLKRVISFVILNQTSISAAHLWFLPALIYTYIFFYITTIILGCDKNRRCFLVIVLMLVRLAVYQYSIMFNPLFFNLYQNFLLCGYPFFMIGILLREKREAFKMCNLKILVLIFLIAEVINLTNTFGFQSASTQFVLCISAISIFVLCLRIDFNIKLFSYIGRYMSTYIYLFHVLVLWILRLLLDSALDTYMILDYFFPFLVISITLLLCYTISKIRKAVVR